MTGMKTNERPGTKAQVRYLRMSASKVRVVLNLIRGKSVSDAHQILKFSERLAAKDIAQVMNSAVANAEHNDEIPGDELYVSACFADEGPTLKRFRPRARGRAGAIHKQTCHITIVVSRYDDETLDRLRERDANRGTKTATADRRARVAKSRGDEAPADEVIADEAEILEAADDTGYAATAEAVVDQIESAGGEAEVTPSIDSDTQDTDGDSVVNASDESPYGDGSHALVDGDPDIIPEGFPVKGNDGSKLYHNEDSPFYGRTKAEVWFATDEAAEAAGFTKPESQQKKEAAAEAADDDAEADSGTKGDA